MSNENTGYQSYAAKVSNGSLSAPIPWPKGVWTTLAEFHLDPKDPADRVPGRLYLRPGPVVLQGNAYAMLRSPFPKNILASYMRLGTGDRTGRHPLVIGGRSDWSALTVPWLGWPQPEEFPMAVQLWHDGTFPADGLLAANTLYVHTNIDKAIAWHEFIAQRAEVGY